MIEAFHKAFLAHFNAATSSPFHVGLTGGLHIHTAPEKTREPYAVFSLVTSTNASTFTEDLRDMLLQINIFSGSPLQTMALADACLKLFHDAEVEPPDTLCTYRLEADSVFGPIRADNSWQASMELSCLIESK